MYRGSEPRKQHDISAESLDDHRALEPPDPIPNSVVKRCIADGSVGFPHVRVGHRQAPIPKPPIVKTVGGFLFLRVLRCFSSPGSPYTPMYSVCNNQLMLAGFPHSEISGSKSVCRLPGAYRRLQRLSSPLTAKASTVCASSLDHITPSNLVIRE